MAKQSSVSGSCFLSAPYGPQARIVMEVLKDLGVLVQDAYSFSIGEDVATSVQERIRDAEFVVAVLGSQSPNVFFEAGLAVGAKKPLAIITAEGAPIPTAIEQSVYLRTNFKDRELLRSFLQRFIMGLRSPHRGRSRNSILRQTSVLPADTLGDLKQLARQVRSQGSPMELERLVACLLDRLGLVHAQHFASASGVNRGVDAVLWSDALSKTLGNPILVEVKWGQIDNNRIENIRRQLDVYLQSTESSTALLLYMDTSGNRIDDRAFGPPSIIPIDVEDLIENLDTESFEEVVLTARNRIVHGH